MSKYDVLDFSNVFYYDITSPSCLRWKIKPANHVQAGDIAGSIAYNTRAWDVLYKRKHYLVHRVIWCLHFGQIDNSLVVNHINCNPLDNRINNLELCSIKENNQRTSLILYGDVSKSNTTGYNGVHYMECFNRDKTIKYQYYVGCVTISGKLERKLFSVSRFGVDQALIMAKDWRDNKIQELVKQGYISFSDKE